MVNFLPTILNQLFCVLTRTTHEDVAVNVTRQAAHTHTHTEQHMCEMPGAPQWKATALFLSRFNNFTPRKLE